MFTITLVIHVDDYHSRPAPKVVETMDEVKAILEQVYTSWVSPGTVVVVEQVGDTFNVKVEN